jgi:hypothetical protein
MNHMRIVGQTLLLQLAMRWAPRILIENMSRSSPSPQFGVRAGAAQRVSLNLSKGVILCV